MKAAGAPGERRAGGRGAGGIRELLPRPSVRELGIYAVFLTDLCLVAFGMVSTDMYYLNRVMARLFLEPSSSTDAGGAFRSIESKADFWRFTEGPLLDGLYWEKWYSNTTSPPWHNYSHIYYENMVLGAAQIRQLKVRNNTCSIYSYFKAVLRDCYSEYHYQAEDTSDFGLRNESEWKYTPASRLSLWYWGSVGIYSSGGYLFTLARSKQESKEKLVFLRQNSWLTQGTRVVFIDFSTYNANINLFCVIRLVVEFPATGGALTSSQIYSVKLLRYVTYYDYFLASCEITFCLFIIMFTTQEVMKIAKLKKEYFRSAWNWLEMLLLLVSILTIIFNIYRTAKVSQLMKELLTDAHVYPDFYFLAYLQVLSNNMIAINVVFAWIKIFKYTSFSKTMTQLSSSLTHSAKDIFGFSLIFFTVFLAYAQLGYLVFGSQVKEFSTLRNCIFTQFRIMLGDFNFKAIEAADRVLGPIYFMTFVFFIFFLLLNMFLAIIHSSYTAVKANFKVRPRQEPHIKDLFKQAFREALVKLRLKKPETDEKPVREGFSATRRKGISELPGEDSDNEESVLVIPKLKELQERYQTSPPPEDGDAQRYVPIAEFRQLIRCMAQLVAEYNNSNEKIRRIRRSMRQLRSALGEKAQNNTGAHPRTERA